MCRKHADMAKKVADAMGFVLDARPAVDARQCAARK
jgi:hypothetical protein